MLPEEQERDEIMEELKSFLDETEQSYVRKKKKLLHKYPQYRKYINDKFSLNFFRQAEGFRELYRYTGY